MKNKGPKLVGWTKPFCENSIIFERKPVILGSGRSAGYQLDKPMVSRRHAQLTLHTDGTCSVKDLESLNGTRLNKEKLRPEQDYQLNHGDSVFFGDQWFRFDKGKGLLTNSQLAWRGIAVLFATLVLIGFLKCFLEIFSIS